MSVPTMNKSPAPPFLLQNLRETSHHESNDAHIHYTYIHTHTYINIHTYTYTHTHTHIYKLQHNTKTFIFLSFFLS